METTTLLSDIRNNTALKVAGLGIGIASLAGCGSPEKADTHPRAEVTHAEVGTSASPDVTLPAESDMATATPSETASETTDGVIPLRTFGDGPAPQFERVLPDIENPLDFKCVVIDQHLDETGENITVEIMTLLNGTGDMFPGSAYVFYGYTDKEAEVARSATVPITEQNLVFTGTFPYYEGAEDSFSVLNVSEYPEEIRPTQEELESLTVDLPYNELSHACETLDEEL
jgi:hypothetical protein